MLQYITSFVKRHQRMLGLMLLASCCAPQLAAQVAAPSGNSPANQIAVKGGFSLQRTFPRISNGYLSSFVRTPQPGAANIVITSLDTGTGGAVTFNLDGASSIQIEDVTVAANDNILVAGLLSRSDNNAKETFLAAVDSTGNVLWRSTLGAYLPQRVCAANDGNTWVLGQDMKKEIGKGDYDLLRTYSSQGELLHSYLSRKSFDLSMGGIPNLGHGSPALLTCGQQSVGVYLGIASTPIWFEVPLAGGSVQQWSVPHRENYQISGLSLLEKGRVFASFTSNRNNKSAGLYTLVPGAGNSANWLPVSGENVTHVARLVGARGGTLFYVQRPIPPEDGPLFQVKADDLVVSNRREIPPPQKRPQLESQNAQQSIPPEKLGKLVDMTAKALADAKIHCKSVQCQAIASDLDRAIGEWKQRDATGTRTSDHDAKTLKDILKGLQDLPDALRADHRDELTLMFNHDGSCLATAACGAASGRWPLSDKPFLMPTGDAHDNCVSNCDRLAVVFGLICSAYAAAGPAGVIAAAICELVVAAEYAKCLASCPPQTPGCS